MKKKVIVIGAGAAGLSSAIRLQHNGYDVELYEKHPTPGGKMNQIEMDGYRFDLGPSLVMMPQVYREVFEYCGRDPDDYIPMKKLDPMYRVYFSDNPKEPIDVSSDMVKWTKTLESFSESDTAGFFRYLNDAYKSYSFSWNNILRRPFRKQTDFYNLTLLKEGREAKSGFNADQFIGRYIKDERLKQMLSFQTLYIGISPFKSPSFYTTIPMTQFLYGVWFIKGGMYTMALSMARLFTELGGHIHYNTSVDEIVIENGKATGVRIDDEVNAADYVVCNADFPYAMKQLVKDEPAKGKYTDKKIDKMKYSCSTLVFYLGMNRKYESVEHIHHFVFDEDMEKNMQNIFGGAKPRRASFYVYIASKMDASLAPDGKDGLYIMMPVSNVKTAKYEWNEDTIHYYRTLILNKLKTIKGFETVEEDIVAEKHMSPLDFESTFNAYNGAVFGLMPTLLQSSHFRPQSKAKHCENLYFNGGSTHPGAGVPIVLLSARITAQELVQDDQGISFGY